MTTPMTTKAHKLDNNGSALYVYENVYTLANGVYTNGITIEPFSFKDLVESVPQEPGIVKVYGNVRTTMRLKQQYGCPHEYGGIYHPSTPYTPFLEEMSSCASLLAKDATGIDVVYNGCIVNVYRNEEDYIPEHSDTYRGLIPGMPIVGFVFGAPRPFRVRPIDRTNVEKGKRIYKDYAVNDGACMVMTAEMQAHYTHEIPKGTKTQGQIGPRVSVTFRAHANTAAK